MSFDDFGLDSKWEGGSARTAWSDFAGIYESPTQILLYRSKFFYLIVPKRAFTPDQLAEFRDLAARHISKKV